MKVCSEMRKTILVLQELAGIYSDKRIPRASAALSYYLTMTFFPLVICLYTMLGSSYDKAIFVLDMVRGLISNETADYAARFLDYVAQNNNMAMMAASIAVLVTSSSAAIRTLQGTIGEMQGHFRYQGIVGFASSFVLSLLFLATVYFAVLVMLTGNELLARLNDFLPFIDISGSWNSLRFVLLAGIEFAVIWGVYSISVSRSDKYSTTPGAIASTIMLVAVSIAFSQFIGASAKYPLVYGSLASIILVMLWLYTCCIVILCGAALNIAIRDVNRGGEAS